MSTPFLRKKEKTFFQKTLDISRHLCYTLTIEGRWFRWEPTAPPSGEVRKEGTRVWSQNPRY